MSRGGERESEREKEALQPLERTLDPGFTPDYAFTLCPTRHRYHRDLILTLSPFPWSRRARNSVSHVVHRSFWLSIERFPVYSKKFWRLIVSNCARDSSFNIWSLVKILISIIHERGFYDSTEGNTKIRKNIDQRLNFYPLPFSKWLNDFSCVVRCWEALEDNTRSTRLLSKTSVIVVLTSMTSGGAVGRAVIKNTWSGFRVTSSYYYRCTHHCHRDHLT